MNTTPEQLRLAADILENNWPWESRFNEDRGWEIIPDTSILTLLHNGHEVRRMWLMPPKPRGSEWHNPDGLTSEQVGDGYRLLVEGEVIPTTYEWYSQRDAKWNGEGVFAGETVPDKNSCCTVRVPISTPYPCGSKIVDGKLVKAWMPRFKVGDRVKISALRHGNEEPVMIVKRLPDSEPLPYTLEYSEGGFCEQYMESRLDPALLPEPAAQVPLEASDVPPGSVFRGAGEIGHQGWCMITSCSETGIRYWRHCEPDFQREVTWRELMDGGLQILRPGQVEWLPCSKPA